MYRGDVQRSGHAAPQPAFQAELEQQRASALLDSYTAQRRLTHEFTNHISALRALLEQGDVGGAQDYIAGVDKAVAASTTIMDTHNPLLDSILTRKYEEATRQGVSVYLIFATCGISLERGGYGHRAGKSAG